MAIWQKLIYIVVFVLLLSVVAMLFLSKKHIGVGPMGMRIFIVLSGSMHPTIPKGSVVFTQMQADYHKGDVITFGPESAVAVPTTHRIVGEKEVNAQKVYQTKGDANEDADQRETPKALVIGKVFFHVPYIGYLLSAARKPIGFMLVVGVPFLAFVVDEGMTIYSELKKRKKKDQDLPTGKT